MKKPIIIYLIAFSAFFLALAFNAKAQASLTIQNNSMRNMAVKIMKGKKGKGRLFKKVNIRPYESETVYFYENGHFFTKTKAVSTGREPVFRRGKPFYITNDETGYSVMTLTFSITESTVPQATGGQAISKQEFDQD